MSGSNLLLGALQEGPTRAKEPLITSSGRRIGLGRTDDKRNSGLMSEEKAFAAFLDQKLPDLLREFEDR